MEDQNLSELGVAAAAAAIRNGDLTSESYASHLLQHARKHADLNSFITIDESAVLAAAEDADEARAAGSRALLLGVPLGVKDSYATRGLRTTIGVETLENFVPDADADPVGAVKDAGGIVFGKNNLVEMSFGLTGSNRHYGQVKNPYGHDRVPGGLRAAPGQLSRPGSCPRHSVATRSVRSGCPRHCVAWWASSRPRGGGRAAESRRSRTRSTRRASWRAT